MTQGELGRVYEAGEVVFRKGEIGDCLFVVQEGEVEVLVERDGVETRLSTVGKDQLLGEMAVFERLARSATVRAIGRARLLTIDKKNFLKRINEDPSLAFRIVETMSRRIRTLSDEVVQLRARLREAERDAR